MTMLCHKIEPLLTRYLLGDLDKATEAEVREHLSACDDCRAAVHDLEPTLGLLRDALAARSHAVERLSVEHRSRIFKARRHRIIQWPVKRIVEIAAVFVVCFTLAGLFLPSLLRTKQGAQRVKEMHLLNGKFNEIDRLLVSDASDNGARGKKEMSAKPARPTEMAKAREQIGIHRSEYGSYSLKGQEAERHEKRSVVGGGLESGGGIGSGDEGALGRLSLSTLQGEIVPKEEIAWEKRLPLSVAKKGDMAEAGKVPVSTKVPLPKSEVTRLAVSAPSAVVRAEPPQGAPAVKIGESKISTDMSSKSSAARIQRLVNVREFQKSREISGSGRADVSGTPVDTRLYSQLEGKDETTARAADAEKGLKDKDTGALVSDDGYIVAEVKEERLKKSEESKEKKEKIVIGKEEPEAPSKFAPVQINPFVETELNPFSTFSIDVDTASYTLARNYMIHGKLPPAEAVRTEEFVNFFDYAYKAPVNRMFAVYTECAPTPFGRSLYLLKIGVKGRHLGREESRPAILTFLIDTSGSMSTADRIGLVKKALHLLLTRLGPNDQVAIVQYDSRARLVLEHTPASEKARILEKINRIQTSGSTNLEQGMKLAYEVAAANFVAGAVNRVLILSDGVANLGTVAAEQILKNVEAYRKQGIYCSVYGFGMGTYDDTMLESLANKGDGAYVFIDSVDEARRVFVDELAATLNVIGSDVKIQVEFNPSRVKRYRQLGYENRRLRKQDFRDDKIDAGEVGSGQSVTALYEIELRGSSRDPIGVVRLRYRDANTGTVEEISRPIRADTIRPRFEDSSVQFRLAASVTAFAEILRGSPYMAENDTEDVARVLRPVALELSLDRRVQELLRLVQGAGSMPRAE